MSSSLVLHHLSNKIKSVDVVTYETELRKKKKKKKHEFLLLKNSLIQLFFTEFKFIDFLHAGLIHFRAHSFSTYAKSSEKLTFLIPLIRTRTYQGVRNISFSENFASVFDE